jgi:hypothetical protein
MNTLRKNQLLGDIRALEQDCTTGPAVETRAILLLARVLLELGASLDHEALEHAGQVDRRLDDILSHVRAIHIQGAETLMATADVRAAMARIDAATTAISERIATLTAKVGTGMSEADVKDVTAGLNAEADKLSAMGSDADNPTPPAA